MVMVIPPTPGGAGDINAMRVRTKLSLWEWARMMGLNPLHFFGLEHNEDPNRSAQCRRPWFEYAWQSADRISREDIARAINEAETQIEDALGFSLLPTWEYDEPHRAVQPNRPELYASHIRDVRGQGIGVIANKGYFIAGGIMGIDLIAEGASVTYNDMDGDGYAETATIVVDTDLTSDPAEITVTVNGDGLYDDGLRVRPIAKITTADLGGGVTRFQITCRREQFVKWELVSVFDPEVALDADDEDTFVSTVDVWRRFNDTTRQAVLAWESPRWCGCSPGTALCDVCGFATQGACLVGRDERLSILSYRPGTWDADGVFTASGCLTVGRAPDTVRLNYRAGLIESGRIWTPTARRPFTDNPYDRMNGKWARLVAHFAASKLDRPICDCGYSQQVLERYNEDMSYTGGAEQTATYNLDRRLLANPFGTRRGAIEAWQQVTNDALGRYA